MGRLIYMMNTSLDGFVEDAAGNFDWTVPSQEVFEAISEIQRAAGTYLYGRRLYETMAVWDSAAAYEGATGQPLADQPAYVREFARMWQAAEKIVYSRSLGAVTTPRTQLRKGLDPEEVRDLKSRTTRDITVGGPGLAAAALGAGLVDDIYLFVAPIVIGKGKSVFPTELRIPLELVDEGHYQSGVVRLHYQPRGGAKAQVGAKG
ncbi:MAG TPA: dihydrofolate reductase family protein [Spirochaetia bacterium]|nr:dihydrofolate reductase family protein [Spirochaetia bacterium]